MTNIQINQAIWGELKELSVASDYPMVAAAIAPPHNTAFTDAFNEAVQGAGGVRNGRWNLAGIKLTPPLSMVAPEECNAISTHGPTPMFDAAKALTNILRLIKAGER